MVELAKRRYSALINSQREQQELTRLAEVEGFIQKRAAQFSRDDPMLAEDLAQQAREAVIRRLRDQPDCPYSHLVNKARDAISRYRQKGKSVDGLLYHRGQARRYDIISLEQPIDTEAGPFEEKPLLREVLSEPVSVFALQCTGSFHQQCASSFHQQCPMSFHRRCTSRLKSRPLGRRNSCQLSYPTEKVNYSRRKHVRQEEKTNGHSGNLSPPTGGRQ